jgi:hypothetical protein
VKAKRRLQVNCERKVERKKEQKKKNEGIQEENTKM